MTSIGCTGHQSLSIATRCAVTAAIAARLARVNGHLIGVCNLAIGADQIFAHLVLAMGGELHCVIPSFGYDETFNDGAERKAYNALLTLAHRQLTLPFDAPSERAYLAAGHAVADNCDILIAVWDGDPAAGAGGTADVVYYAKSHDTAVEIVWPVGSSRD